MPAESPTNLYKDPDKRSGQVLGTYSYPATVVNKNALQAQSNPDDVYRILDGTDTYHANVVPISTFDAAYLGLSFWSYASDASATTTTDPVVRVYGHIPNPTQKRNAATWPQDVFSEFYDLNDADITEQYRGLWIPLTKPNYTLGTPEITLPGPAANRVVTLTSTEDVSEVGYVFIGGCDYAIVAVQTAAVLSAGATKRGVIVGHLFG